MRRFVLGLVTALLLILSVPAAAHPRDPFVPLIAPAATAAGDAGAPEEPPAARGDDAPAPAAVTAGERLPATGGNLETWLVVAYMVIAAGAAAVVLGKTFRPGRVGPRGIR
ncbi:MAG TPA: hypothetical protein VM784_02630 [Actinomycetota bacterium]|nr:hypothetical protein [Actinomycetota bacterium]